MNYYKIRNFLFLFLIIFVSCGSKAEELPKISLQDVGIDRNRLLFADNAILDAIDNKDIPGAVLAIVKDGKMAYLKAYGDREIYPRRVKMDVNTVFDLASVTKSIATATSVMILVERGQLRLIDKVNLYIPNFEPWKSSTGEKVDIRIIDLLTHTSGLPSYASVQKLSKMYGSPNPDGLINYIATCDRNFEPTTDMQYSCLSYITLQRIVEKISKKSLQEFAKENIFDVLGMKHTDFNPKGENFQNIAPTEKGKDGNCLRGVVHDPLARVMNGGVSGNAGLFSNANDLALFAAALMNGGELNSKRILSPLGVKKMTSVPKETEQFGRALGWDISSPYASCNGDLLSSNTYGHTGYTGTSIVIDPDNKVAVILLTNRVHPNDRGSVVRLRSIVANAVAASIMTSDNSDVKTKNIQFSDYYYDRILQFDREPAITSNDIVMLGNSITEGGKDWNKRFAMNNVVNRGISGDVVEGVYQRLESIVAGKPKKIFLKIGINNLARHATSDSIVNGITKIIDKIQKESPKTELYLQSLLPINESTKRWGGLAGKTEQIPEINKKLKKLAKAKNITYIDLFPRFKERRSNSLRMELTYDGLHLNDKGYDVWIKQLEKYMK